MLRLSCFLLMVILLEVMGGCARPIDHADPHNPDAVLVLHGVDGAGPWYDDLFAGLRDGGIKAHCEMVEWGTPLAILSNLQLPAVHRDAESKLAKRLSAWRAAHPIGRISLIGHSAGCGVILATLGNLPADFTVNDVVLLAPAVSRDYNLAPPLAHVRGTLYVFYSDKDQALLNLGTSVAGTYDGVWGQSAGMTGFTTTPPLPPKLQSHLQQIAYKPEYAQAGNNGDHFGWRQRAFVRQYIAPLLLAH